MRSGLLLESKQQGHLHHSFPQLSSWSLGMEPSRRVSPASQSSLCPPRVQPGQLGCRSGKTEDELKGSRGPLKPEVRVQVSLDMGRAGVGRIH